MIECMYVFNLISLFVIIFSIGIIVYCMWRIRYCKDRYSFLSKYLEPTGNLIITKDEDGSYMFLELYNEDDKLYDGYEAVFKVIIIDESQE